MNRALTLRYLLFAVCAVAVFSTAIVQILVVLLTLAAVWSWFAGDGRVLRWTPLHAPFAAFLLCRILSIAFSLDPTLSMRALYIEYFFYLPFFIASGIVTENPLDALRTFSRVIVLAGMAAAFLGSTLFLLGVVQRAESTTAGPYTLGGFLCLALPFAAFAPQSGRKGSSLLHWLQLSVICLGIILTFDRLHWFSMAATIIIAGVVSRRRLLLIPVVLSTLVLFVSPAVQQRFLQLFHIGEYLTGRDVLWRGAAMLWNQHPIVGFGPRTFHEIFPLFDEMPIRGVGSWHNDYLQVYLESGLLGLLPLLWLVGSLVVYGWKALSGSHHSDDEYRYTLAAYAALLTSLVIGGMLDTIIGIPLRILLGIFAQQIVTLLKAPSTPISEISLAVRNA